MSYTGPTVRLVTLGWPGQTGLNKQYSRDQRVYKTTPGTTRGETPYDVTLSFFDNASKYGNVGSNPYPTCVSNSNQTAIGRNVNDYYGLKPRALNRARSRFISSMKESRESSLGTALAEFDKTLLMIGSRLKQMWQIAKAVKAGDLRYVRRLLGHPIDPKGWREKAKQPARLFLELHFGWSPLLGDIHDGMRLISEPLPSDGRVRSSGRASNVMSREKTYDSGGVQPSRIYASGVFEVLCELRGLTKVTNPNLDLLQSLGLANPAEVIWELVPFSFLIDHVVGIGNFLSSFSDELGWNISDLAISTLSRVTQVTEERDHAVGGAFPYGTKVGGAGTVFNRSRAVTLPPYELTFTNPFTGLSASRAMTYCSLLLVQLKSM